MVRAVHSRVLFCRCRCARPEQTRWACSCRRLLAIEVWIGRAVGATTLSRCFEFSADDSAFATRAIAGSAHEFCCVRRISGIGEYIARIIRKDGALADPRLVEGSSSFTQHCRGSIGGASTSDSGHRVARSDDCESFVQCGNSLTSKSNFAFRARARSFAVSSCHRQILSQSHLHCQSLLRICDCFFGFQAVSANGSGKRARTEESTPEARPSSDRRPTVGPCPIPVY